MSLDVSDPQGASKGDVKGPRQRRGRSEWTNFLVHFQKIRHYPSYFLDIVLSGVFFRDLYNMYCNPVVKRKKIPIAKGMVDKIKAYLSELRNTNKIIGKVKITNVCANLV